MRLTLRYLLAYLDDYLLPQGSRKILEPEDFDAIRRKVEESDFAKSLVERIEDVVRRARLGAPGETDRGTGLDPNTVAEYLDHALPDARVPDFEKVCLESDVHLAEVACCHQILAMVVTEPVEVVEETRQAIYQLPEALAMETEDEEASLPAEILPERVGEPEDETQKPAKRRSKAESRQLQVPEYLRQAAAGARWAKRLAVVAGLLVLIVLAVLWLGGSGETGNLWSRVLAWRQSGDEREEISDGSAGPSEPTNPADSPAPRSGTSVAAQPSANESASSGLAPAGRTSGGERPAASSAPGRDKPGLGTKAGSAVPPSAPADGATDKSAAQARGPEMPGEGSAAPDVAGVDGDKASASKTPPPSVQPANAPLGFVVSTKQLLLRLNAKTGVWQRVADEMPMFGSERLVSLPAFRPRLSFARTSLELADATDLTVLPPAGSGPAGIAVEFGRVVVKAEEGGGASLRIVVGDHPGVCQLVDADSVVAFEAGRAEAGGADPETQPGALAVDLYVTSGKAVWRDDRTGKQFNLTAPRRLSVSEQPLEPVVLQQLPRWVVGEAGSALDQRAAGVLEREVMLGRSAMLALRELTSHRQREVRWLAMRSLSLVEDYRPLLASLDDPEQYRFWSEHIDQLRWAVFRSPQSAANVRKAMERQYGPQGAELYEMLWKYRPDTLQPEDANRLVDFLGHGALPFRILSFWNLKKLFDNRTLYYRPDDPPQKRQMAIQKWRELLKTGPMLRSEPPSPPDPARKATRAPDESPPEDGS